MALLYDVDEIFKELEKQVREKDEKQKEATDSQENDPIESPDDAPQTQEVAPANLKETEETHGGDEASKEIEESTNSAEDGENSEKENKTEKTKNNGKQMQDTYEKNESESKSIEGESKIAYSKKIYEDSQKVAEKIFEDKEKKLGAFKTQNQEEYLKKYILEIIKKIAARHAGIDKQDGVETYDKKQMLQHMLKQQNHKLLGDKYDLKDARNVQFFIDTSGVYGCGSNKILHELMPEVISILEKQGYECYIAACGNGFSNEDLIEDKYYETRKTLEGYKAGKVNKIACPTPETAAKMANEAEFSIILADFDGLSSICEMASLCQKGKVPYFLSTEDRYPWEEPTLHDWVELDLCEYDLDLVYDVSVNGNPTLEEYEYMNYYDKYYDNDQNDDYELGD